MSDLPKLPDLPHLPHLPEWRELLCRARHASVRDRLWLRDDPGRRHGLRVYSDRHRVWGLQDGRRLQQDRAGRGMCQTGTALLPGDR